MRHCQHQSGISGTDSDFVKYNEIGGLSPKFPAKDPTTGDLLCSITSQHVH